MAEQAAREAAPRGDLFAPSVDERDRERSLVIPAAVLLLLTGILGLLAGLVQVAWVARNTWFPPPVRAQPPQNALETMIREAATGPVPMIIGAVFGVVSILVILAAVQMLRLRSYRFAVAGTVLAMVNFANLCCILGLPVGIWALVILSKPEVKLLFQTRNPPPSDESMS